MRTAWALVPALLLATAAAAQRGVPQNGFPSWQERTVLVYANRARADPQAELAGCTNCAEKACYSPTTPLVWSYNLSRAARFHSKNVRLYGTLTHDSPCTLVSGISALYPPEGTCDGAASCACVGGTYACNTTCTTTWGRISAFGTTGNGENIAYGYTSPSAVHYGWIWERDTSTACGFRTANGHRYNILNPSLRSLGTGWDQNWWTQDFSNSGTLAGTLIAGSHEPQLSGGNVTFRVNYYDTRGGPLSGQLNVGGSCVALTLERGTATNGTWSVAQSLTGTTCRRYQFVFSDPAGATVTLPETGSYGVGGDLGSCPDYSASAPPACGGGSNAAPSIATPAAANPNPAPGTTTAVSVLGADDGGEPALTYTWSATGPAAVTFSPNGTHASRSATASFTATGSYTLTATVRDTSGLTATSAVTVTVNPTPTSIAVSPASISVVSGGTQQFTASARDQFGRALATQPAFVWAVGGGGTLNASGLFTAGTTPGGPHTVTARSGSASGTAQVTVVAGGDTRPPAISLTSPGPGAVLTGTAGVTANATDDVGVVRVVFSVDGNVAGEDTAAPWQLSLDTRALADGPHQLSATARDAAGNTAVSESVAVVVDNGGPEEPGGCRCGASGSAPWGLWLLVLAKVLRGRRGTRGA